MRRAHWIALAVMFLAVPVTAQVVVNAVLLQDVKSNGTAIGYFHKVPTVKSWNFVRGARVSGSTMLVEEHSAPFNPDLGNTVGPTGVQEILQTALPTCNATERGTVVNVLGSPDGGVNDTASQCCYRGDGGVYTWVTGYCH